MDDIHASSRYDKNGFKDIKINSVDDAIRLYEILRGKKLSWFGKTWFKIENYFECKLERIFKLR